MGAPKSTTVKAAPTRSLAAAKAEYTRRAAALRQDDTEGRFHLAKWCLQMHLNKSGRRALLAVVKADPEHTGARTLLGHQKVNGKWLTAWRAHQALGHVRYKGTWYTKEEGARVKAVAKERLRIKRLQRKVNSLARQLAGSSEKRRVKARDDLVAIARSEKLPHIEKAARHGFEVYKSWWSAYRTALVEVRLTQATLVGLRRRSLSLGTGSPVTIELPELRKVSIGTTVSVPLGR